ncbi:MAG: acetyl-CoA carboxylase biotin carboxyl carrier protein subunit [Actinobacteria bacterium]|nr:MAG: acetyl-CoA carboxylase biotin carboxyl carrier protein subunit [Actinomycetota bacterium]
MRVQSQPRPISSEIAPDSMGESAAGFGFLLVVSPAAGRLRRLPTARFHEGDEWVSPGQAVALVEQGSNLIEVKSPFEARVAGVLVRDGEPVQPGQPLVWLEGGGR